MLLAPAAGPCFTFNPRANTCSALIWFIHRTNGISSKAERDCRAVPIFGLYESVQIMPNKDNANWSGAIMKGPDFQMRIYLSASRSAIFQLNTRIECIMRVRRRWAKCTLLVQQLPGRKKWPNKLEMFVLWWTCRGIILTPARIGSKRVLNPNKFNTQRAEFEKWSDLICSRRAPFKNHCF